MNLLLWGLECQVFNSQHLMYNVSKSVQHMWCSCSKINRILQELPSPSYSNSLFHDVMQPPCKQTMLLGDEHGQKRTLENMMALCRMGCLWLSFATLRGLTIVFLLVGGCSCYFSIGWISNFCWSRLRGVFVPTGKQSSRCCLGHVCGRSVNSCFYLLSCPFKTEKDTNKKIKV